MKYYFCSMMGTDLKRDTGYLSSVLVDDSFKGAVGLAEMVLNEEDNRLEIVPEGKAGDKKIVDVFENLASKMVDFTDEELVHTDENPLVVVATRSFKVPEGVKTYIKYIPVRGGVVVALLSGVLYIEDENGSYTTLVRNVKGDVYETNLILFKATEIDKLNILKDIKTGVLYNNNVISDCIINITRDKSGMLSKSVRFNKNCFTVLNQGAFDEGAKKMELAKEKKEQDRLKRIEAAEKFAEAQRLKKQREESEKAAKKSKSKGTKKKVVKAKEEVKTATGSDGAKSFLDYVNSLKG